MTGVIGTIVGAVIFGVIIGALARLVLPGKQDLSLAMTIGAGLVGGLAGGLLSEVIGVRETSGMDWIKLVLQVGLAAAAVTVYGNLRHDRSQPDTYSPTES